MLRCKIHNKIIQSHGFDNNVIKLIPDIEHIRVRSDIDKKGWNITIFQEVIEAPDIVIYFTDRFNKKFSKKDIKNKIVFDGYYEGVHNGKKVSFIRFYYRANLFERKLLKSGKY